MGRPSISRSGPFETARLEWPHYSHLFTAEQLRELGPRGSMADNGVTDVEVTPALWVFKQAQTLLDSDRISLVR